MDSIYDDLDVVEDIEIKYKETQHLNSELTFKISLLEGEITRLNSTLADMKKKQKQLENNISSLYNTAKAELSRKDRHIAELETRLDTMGHKNKNNKSERHDYSSRSSSPSSRDRRGKNSYWDKDYRDRSDNRRDYRDRERNKDRERSRRKSPARRSRSPSRKRTRLDHSRDKDTGRDKTKDNDKSAKCINFEEVIGKPSKILEALRVTLEKSEPSFSRSSRSSVKYKDDKGDKDIPHRRVTRNQTCIANQNKEECETNKHGFVKVFAHNKQNDSEENNQLNTQATKDSESEIPYSDSEFVIFDTQIERSKGTCHQSSHKEEEHIGNIEECFLFEKKLSDIIEEVKKDASKLQSNENQKITQTNGHVTAQKIFKITEDAKNDVLKPESTDAMKTVGRFPPSCSKQVRTLIPSSTKNIAKNEKHVPENEVKKEEADFFNKGASELILQALTFAGVLVKPVANEHACLPEASTLTPESTLLSDTPLNGPSETDKATSKTLPEILPIGSVSTSITSTNSDITTSNLDVNNLAIVNLPNILANEIESVPNILTPDSTKEDSSNSINTTNLTDTLINKENVLNNEAASYEQIISSHNGNLEMLSSVICGLSPGPLGRGKPRPKRRRGVVRMID